MKFFKTLKSNFDANSFYISRYDSYEEEALPSWRKIGKQFGNKYRKIEANVFYSWIDKGYDNDENIAGLKETYIKDKYVQASQLQIDPKNTVAGILENLCDVYSSCGYWFFTEEMKDMDFIPVNVSGLEDFQQKFRSKTKSSDFNKSVLNMLMWQKYEEDVLLRPKLFLFVSEVFEELEEYNDRHQAINCALNSIFHRDSLAYPVLHQCISHKIKAKKKLHIKPSNFEETLYNNLNEIKSKYGVNAYPDRIMDLSVDSIIKKLLI